MLIYSHHQAKRLVNVFVNSELWASEFAGLQDHASHVVLCIYSCRLPNQTRAGRVCEGLQRDRVSVSLADSLPFKIQSSKE